MKKIAIFALFFWLYNLQTKAQNANPVLQDTIKKALVNGHQAVTGAAQDILATYLQVAAKNIVSNNSNLQLKVTWFALNSMDSIHKYNNVNYLRTWWQRNLEFQAV